MWDYLLFKNICGWVTLNEESSNDGLMEKFNNFTPNLRFTYESSEKKYLISWPHNYFIRTKVEDYLTYKVYRSPSVPTLCLLTPSTKLFSAKH